MPATAWLWAKFGRPAERVVSRSGWPLYACTCMLSACWAGPPAATAHTRQQNNTRSCAIEQMTTQCAPYMGALKIFGTRCPWLCPRATATFPTFFMCFCLIDPINVCANFKVRSFTRSWDKGYPKNLGSPGYAHALYPPKNPICLSCALVFQRF